MYVIGTTRSMSTTAPISSHATSTWSMSAMSAMEQPAFRSGRTTRWSGVVRTSADSAMKCTPQKTMSVAVSSSAATRASLKESPRRVGPLDDLVALVVVPEDQEAVAERFLGGPDLRVERFG